MVQLKILNSSVLRVVGRGEHGLLAAMLLAVWKKQKTSRGAMAAGLSRGLPAHMPREPSPPRFAQLLVWVRERPEDYCRTVGELEILLRQLYEISAAEVGRQRQLSDLLARRLAEWGLPSTLQVIDATERDAVARRGEPAVERLISFWSALDGPLGLASPGTPPPA